jgi:hypothetical protein
MSKASPAKNSAESWQFIWREYQREHPGAFRPIDVVNWAIERGLADLPKINPRSILVRNIKRAAREIKITDPQDRIVREMLPARIPFFDENGQMYLDVVYDHIHSMTVDHALLAFDQRDGNITKQKRSATRDLQSVLDNNPNVKGHEEKFLFDFLEDAPAKPTVEKVAESPTGKAPKPR